MTVLIIGGTGYIGSHTTLAIAAAGFKSVALDNFSNSRRRVVEVIHSLSLNQGEITFVEGDVRDTELLREVLRKHAITSVIHFAALKSVSESVENPLKYYEINISGLISLLTAMDDYGVRKLVFSSSCTVYGNPSLSPIKEEAPRVAANPYGHTKIISEQLLETLCNTDRDWLIYSLRYFNPIGAHPSGLLADDPIKESPNVIPSILRVALGLEDHFRIFGNTYDTPDGSAIRDYIHVMDLSSSHVHAVRKMMGEGGDYDQSSNTGFVPINVGLGRGISVYELLRCFELSTGVSIPCRVFPRRAGDAGNVYCDVSMIRKVLPNWSPAYTIADECLHALNAAKIISRL